MTKKIKLQSHENIFENIVQDSFSEHIGYDFVLKHVMESFKSRRRFANLDLKSSYQMRISLQRKIEKLNQRHKKVYTF
jgi:hypothetical protein